MGSTSSFQFIDSDKFSLSSTESRKFTIFVICACLVALTLRLAPLTRSLDAIDGHFMPDDAYLSLEIAKNIGRGKGPWYETNYTNGYQPLYVLLAAPFYQGFAAINSVEALDFAVKQSIAVVVAFDVVSVLLLALILARLYGWSLATIIGVSTWVIHPYVVGTALNGLETSMACTLLLGVSYCWSWMRRSHHIGKRFLFGVLIGFGVLARIDFAVVGFWILLLELNDVRTGQSSFKAAARALIATFIGFLCCYLPWLLWSYSYTGLWFPVSGPAVRFQTLASMNHEIPLWFRPAAFGLVFLEPIIKAPLLYLFSGIVLGVCLIQRARGKANWFHLLQQNFQQWPLIWLFAGSLLLAYGLYQHAWWFYSRYLFVTVLTAIFILAAFTRHWEQLYAPQKRRFLPLGILLLFTLHGSLLKPLIGPVPDPGIGYRAIGLWIKDHAAQDAVVGAMQTGGIAYYAESQTVLNLDGVVNQEAFEDLQNRSMERYLEKYNAQYFIGWPENTRYLLNYSFGGKGASKNFLQPLEELPYTTWSIPVKWTFYRVNLPTVSEGVAR